MYAQIIDDSVGNTLVAASTNEKAVKAELEHTNDTAAATYVGTLIAKRALEKGIEEVVFDRDKIVHARSRNRAASVSCIYHRTGDLRVR